ncbi:MAG: hypothetical protein FWG66_01330 [Spirochaetes bacterium]|nr:hypothetical protein [Spirochaetota bacterium]
MNCKNHPEREANNLCMSCSNWYCNSCMAFSQTKPCCKTCAALDGKPGLDSPRHSASSFLDRILSAPDTLKTTIKAGLCIGFVGILGLTILFQTMGLAFLFGINYNFLRYVPAFIALVVAIGGFALLGKKGKKNVLVKNEITFAQIEALLKSDNRLTVRRLANATNTSEETAQKYLDKMASEGKLDISSDSHELIYSKNPVSS